MRYFLIIALTSILFSCDQKGIFYAEQNLKKHEAPKAQTQTAQEESETLLSQLIAPQQPHALKREELNPKIHGNTPPLLWTSRHATQDLGSDIIKLSLSDKTLQKQGFTVEKNISLSEIAKHTVIKQSLDLNYSLAFFWAHGKTLFKYYNPAKNEAIYQEFFEFTSYLLKNYNDSGKTFMIGNWEGDWLMGAKHLQKNEDISQEQIQKMINWLNIRGKAIEDAKNAVAHKNVNVYFYAEVNLVRMSRTSGSKRMTNSVLPHCKHLDYVSISSYETQNITAWRRPHTEKSLKSDLYTDLDYVENLLAPRPGLKGRRVGIGEIGYPLVHVMNTYKVSEAKAEIIQARLALLSAQVNLEWGTPFWLWWGIHHNEENNLKKYSDHKFKGFGIIDQATGQKTRLWHEFYDYNKWANTQNTSNSKRFRKNAITWLKSRVHKLDNEISKTILFTNK
ncbi:hypothetical protein PQO03_01665 [Lentisphaera profundi]|uniref:Lipoprotein n=1 Tax=Lentisphaera profundi TaxID=1658616 RepID=A0ABY7VTN6_9BACT|nr:hypothetical protein [Lentisphaera profundi]WDE96674.1 hypothetical protein PQO03_01665 [Lentisphaera profundi]